jgi:glycogen debranching enzyme
MRARAKTLKQVFHSTYWIDSLGTYAMALDGRKRPLAVTNSNVGHLLWTGIVPESHAQAVRDALFNSDLWTGWGFRTLGYGEKRYNPVSYHNGSVWPHDTAIAARGLARYGFVDDAIRVRKALFDLAAGQSDMRLPELVAGYERSAGPPVPYPVACRPQAWDAGALIYLLDLRDLASIDHATE